MSFAKVTETYVTGQGVAVSAKMNATPGTQEVETATRTRLLVFGSLCAVSILLWWPSLVTTLKLALGNEAYTHILLILPLSISLIYIHLNASRTVSQWNILAGLVVLGGAAVLSWFARWSPTEISADLPLSLTVLALVLWWIGSVTLCFGTEMFQSLLFPLCFLFLLVPLPSLVLNEIVYFLQHQSAVAARILFLAVGVPVTQDGTVLSIPNLNIEVARECSSIRSSLMLIVVSLFLAYLFLRSGWRRLLLVAAAIPLSVAKNGLRIFTIAELGTRVDAGFLDGRLHHHGGIVFFGISVAAVVALLLVLQRTESRAALACSCAFSGGTGRAKTVIATSK